MKPYWFACNNLRITNCSLSARSFVKSLISILRREMGLQSFTDSGLLILATSVMKEMFILSRLTSRLKKTLQSLQKSSLIICQHILTNKPLKPSFCQLSAACDSPNGDKIFYRMDSFCTVPLSFHRICTVAFICSMKNCSVECFSY